MIDLMMLFAVRTIGIFLGTMRIKQIALGKAGLAMLYGFFENIAFIWSTLQVVVNYQDFRQVLVYAAAFALGTYLGIRKNEVDR